MRSVYVLAGGAVLALGLLGYLAARRASASLPAGAFDPLSTENLAYRGVNEIGAQLTGDEQFAVGVAVFNALERLKAPFLFLSREPDLTAPTIALPPGALPASDPWPTGEQSPFAFGA